VRRNTYRPSSRGTSRVHTPITSAVRPRIQAKLRPQLSGRSRVLEPPFDGSTSGRDGSHAGQGVAPVGGPAAPRCDRERSRLVMGTDAAPPPIPPPEQRLADRLAAQQRAGQVRVAAEPRRRRCARACGYGTHRPSRRVRRRSATPRTGDPGFDAQCREQVIDRTGGDPVHVGLHHHWVQGLIDPPPRLQDHREERALAQLRAREF